MTARYGHISVWYSGAKLEKKHAQKIYLYFFTYFYLYIYIFFMVQFFILRLTLRVFGNYKCMEFVVVESEAQLAGMIVEINVNPKL